MTIKHISKKYKEVLNKVDSLVINSDVIEELQNLYYTENKSYLSEYPSVIIYLVYRLKVCKESESEIIVKRIYYYLHKLIECIKTNSTNNITLCYGFTGYAYALKFLSEKDEKFNNLSNVIETMLLSLVKDRLSEIKKITF